MPKNTFFNLPQEKRDKIIDGATQAFSKQHYKKVTVDNIVNNAGIPKGSFYQYFENKDDLYLYVFNQIGDEKKQVLDELQESAGTLNIKEYMMKLLQRSLEFEKNEPGLAELKNKFMNECPQEIKKAVLANEIPKSHRLLEEVLREYVKKGELKKDLDIKTAAYMITACSVGLENYEFDKGSTIEDVFFKIMDIFIRGME